MAEIMRSAQNEADLLSSAGRGCVPLAGNIFPAGSRHNFGRKEVFLRPETIFLAGIGLSSARNVVGRGFSAALFSPRD